jgi:hypothetical protein
MTGHISHWRVLQDLQPLLEELKRLKRQLTHPGCQIEGAETFGEEEEVIGVGVVEIVDEEEARFKTAETTTATPNRPKAVQAVATEHHKQVYHRKRSQPSAQEQHSHNHLLPLRIQTASTDRDYKVSIHRNNQCGLISPPNSSSNPIKLFRICKTDGQVCHHLLRYLLVVSSILRSLPEINIPLRTRGSKYSKVGEAAVAHHHKR